MNKEATNSRPSPSPQSEPRPSESDLAPHVNPRVGFFSPLPPARTGVADYSEALLRELRTHGRVDIAPSHCDVALYHLGNNSLHAEIYRRALAEPGVAVLHDAVLQHFFLGQLGETAYIDEFVYNYGEWNRDLALDLWRRRAGSASDDRYFRYPMLKRIAERSRAVVVHNPAAAQAVRDHAPDARIVQIPHLFSAPALPDAAAAFAFRRQLGIEPTIFLFGVFGYLRESKRLIAVLQAFRELYRQVPSTGLLVAGEFVSTDLERAVEPMLREPGVVRVPYLAEHEFWLAASAVDACINLRYPTAGESSGIAVRMMGIGKPVFLTEGLEIAGIPEDACVRIPAGIAERDSLLHHMILLTSFPRVSSALGRRGAAHVETCHCVKQAGKKYWDLLCASCI
uniref:Glycosyl transferase, group 1 n=1 Tax=Solibacter usitatus (strain Ellin6076) TaxID=234267 RepID=Q026R7_SOLUE